jgi:hypothetical protein
MTPSTISTVERKKKRRRRAEGVGPSVLRLVHVSPGIG